MTRVGRRALLTGVAATAFGSSAEALGRTPSAPTPAPVAAPAPVLFVSHGAPLYAPPDAVRIGELAAWGRSLPPPSAIVVMTPHFAARGAMLGPTGRGFAMYDLPGRIKRLIPPELDYASPESSALGARVEAIVGAPIAKPSRRGFDHTTWMPLLAMFPGASAPVVELGYPYLTDRQLFDLGLKLARLRGEGVTFLASGGMTHNLAAGADRIGRVRQPGDPVAPPPSWSVEFDAWAKERLEAQDVDALVDWRRRAPAAEIAHPDDGAHFRVLLVALGVALGGASAGVQVTFPVDGHDGALSKRCVALGG